MENQVVKDLPLYINGFAVGYLFVRTECNVVDIIMFGLAMLSLFWYGRNQKPKTVYYGND